MATQAMNLSPLTKGVDMFAVENGVERAEPKKRVSKLRRETEETLSKMEPGDSFAVKSINTARSIRKIAIEMGKVVTIGNDGDGNPRVWYDGDKETAE